MLALLDNLDFGEILIVLLASIVIFGKNLPRVAGQVGLHLGRARRALDKLWRETGVERELRNVQREIEQAVPRDLSLGDMARQASAEVEQRMRANESAARPAQVPHASDTPGTAGAAPAPSTPPATPKAPMPAPGHAPGAPRPSTEREAG